MTYLAEGDGPDLHPGEVCKQIHPIKTVIHGKPKVHFLAVCMDCGAPGGRPIPMPFGTEAERDRWAGGHASTGHHVEYALEICP